MLADLPRRKKGIVVTVALCGVFAVITAVILIWRGSQSEVYVPGEAIEGVTSSLDRELPPEVAAIRFEDVAEAAGIDFLHFPGTRTSQLPEDMGSGVSWGDFDGDGWDDLYVTNLSGPLTSDGSRATEDAGRNILYRNTQDGRFEDVSREAGVDMECLCSGAAWSDYDNDGDLDLFVTAYGENRLYRNRGNGTFEDATAGAGVGGLRGFWAGASWGDYDRDGWLDLYVTGYVKFVPGVHGETTMQYDVESPASINPSSFEPERNLLYRNNSDGTFSEVGEFAGVDNPLGRSLSAAWADFDNDGWVDLYVANDVSDNVFFRNRGNGTFEDISHLALVADYRGAMGLAVGDWDSDLDLDLFVTHWIAQENALYSNLVAAGEIQTEQGKYQPILRFIDVADRFGLGQIALDYVGWGTFFFDYDNDGHLDLFVANGSTLQEREDPTKMIPMRDMLFWSGGAERGFFEVSSRAGSVFATPQVSRGAAYSDYDQDGDLDIAVLVHGGPVQLLRNEGHPFHHWVGVKLVGSRSNRMGLGSRVRVRSGDLESVEEVGSQPSYLSQNSIVVHFGLGARSNVDTLEVRWPGGHLTRLLDVTVDQIVTVHEDP